MTQPTSVHDWVLAAPFRYHLGELISVSGLPWRAVSLHAEIPISTARSLLFGRRGRTMRRIARLFAERIIELDATGLAALSYRAGDPGLTHMYARHLTRGGCAPAALALLTRATRDEVTAWLSGPPGWVSARVELLLRTACQISGLAIAQPRDPWDPGEIDAAA